MRVTTLCLLLALLGVTPGCGATLSNAAAAVRELPKPPSELCKLLGAFNGSSGFNGWFFPAEDRARAEALEQAAEAGATHIVWTESDEGFLGGHAACLAYLCEKVAR